jgi:hypothetical protein
MTDQSVGQATLKIDFLLAEMSESGKSLSAKLF